MTRSEATRLSRALTGISGGTLLAALMFLSFVIAASLSAAIVAGAARGYSDLARHVEDQTLKILERDGLSGLVAEIDRLDGMLVPGLSEVEFAVWRTVAGDQRLLRESKPGISESLETVAARVDIGEHRYGVFKPDVATASEAWDITMKDVNVSYAIGLPTSETRNARRVLIAVWVGYLFAASVGVALHVDHRRRYRSGLEQINTVLEEFAAGNTSAQVSIETRTPELQRLSNHLLRVLPRFDRLLGDLRGLTAHLAHELKTPLQILRADAHRLAVTGDPECRQNIAHEIDITIDRTDARLKSVMQLFRLSAESEVSLQPETDLSHIAINELYDFEDFFEARNQVLEKHVDDNIMVVGNPPLLELLLSNLLSNATKFGPQNARIGVELTAISGRFALTVWNTGSSFPEAWMRRSFQRLSRGKTDNGVPGFGLGLALVDVICRRHGFQATPENRADPSSGNVIAAVTVRGPCDAGR